MKQGFKIIILLISLSALGLGIFNSLNMAKLAYVNNYRLLEEFDGMIDATRTFEKESQQLQTSVDSISVRLKSRLSIYNTEREFLTKEDRIKEEKILMGLRQTMEEQMQYVEKKLLENEEVMTQGVLSQINSFLKTYGAKHNYQLILGSDMEGNILYGEDQVDITDELIEALNQDYHGK